MKMTRIRVYYKQGGFEEWVLEFYSEEEVLKNINWLTVESVETTTVMSVREFHTNYASNHSPSV